MKKLLILIVAFLSACVSGYEQFYTDTTGGRDVTKSTAVEIPSGPPKVGRGGDYRIDKQKMQEDGYLMLGYSSFNAGGRSYASNKDAAVEHGKKVHAAVVLLYSKYTHTQTGTYTYTVPQTTTSTTNLSGNVTGGGGYVNYYGTGTTTTTYNQTHIRNYDVQRYDFLATFWIKRKPRILGVLLRDVQEDTRKRLGSNQGLLVIAVVKKSPAYKADLVKDDIILEVGKTRIYSFDDYKSAITNNQGKQVKLLIWRDGKKLRKTAKLRKVSY